MLCQICLHDITGSMCKPTDSVAKPRVHGTAFGIEFDLCTDCYKEELEKFKKQLMWSNT